MNNRILLFLFFLVLIAYGNVLYGQPNCTIYKSEGNDACYEACIIATNPGYYQGQRASQIQHDKAIEICPSFAYSYKVKSIPYLKRGLYLEWKRLIDLAVLHDPVENLGYRGWCRFQFLHDFQGAIEDIEKLKKTISYDIGFCQNGAYHLDVALGIFYKEIGQPAKCIQLIEENHLKHEPGLFDFLHLGVAYLDKKEYVKAEAALKKQIENNPLSETYYYLTMAYIALGNIEDANKAYAIAEEKYSTSHFLTDPYGHPIDRIFLSDLESLKNTLILKK